MGKQRPEEVGDVRPAHDVDAAERQRRNAHDAGEAEVDPAVEARSRALATQEASGKQAGQGTDRQAATGATPAAGAAPATALVPGLARVTSAPPGKRFAHLDGLEAALIPPAFRPEDPSAQVGVALLVDGDRLVVHVAVGAEHWVTSLSAGEAVEAIAGKQAAAHIASASEWIQKLGSLDVTNQRVRIQLFGAAPNDSFVVLDLLRIVLSVGRDTLGGLRPVEAQLVLPDKEGTNVAGARLFAGQHVQGVSGKPIGGWFPLPNVPAVRAALGPDADAKQDGLVAGAFYADGMLQLAVKESAEATTGLVAHLNLEYLAKKLKAFGDKIASWVEALLKKIASGSLDLFRSISLGKLRLELPDIPGFRGIWFDFDFNLSLPRLFKGGGGGGFELDLSGLWPSGFNLDFGGLSLGAMPKLSFPWLRAPKLGGFDIPWERIQGLLPSIDLPSLQLPALPSLSFGFHRISGLKFGFGTDLSLAWPELGDLSLGFTLDLGKILDKLAGAGKWLLNKLKAAGDFLQRWIHFGSDGVLRIYDGQRPDGPTVGFHLLKLLDGAQETDLAPTEMRWTEGAAGIAMELGEAQGAPTGAPESPEDKGKGRPERPGGVLLTERKGIAAPASLVDVMSLAPDATIDVSLHVEGGKLVVFSEAPSTLYEHGQALRTSLDVTMLAQRVISRWQPANGKPPPISSFELDTDPARSQDGPRVNFTVPSALGVKGASGYAVWKVEDLLRAKNWTDLAPAAMQLAGEGVGGVQLGKLDYSLVGPPLGGQRFPITSDKLAKKLLRDDDPQVHAAFHKKDDVIGVSLAKEADGEEGLLTHVHLSFLLDKLKRLGELGRRALEKLSELAFPGRPAGGGDVFARVAEIARALADKLVGLANGLLSFDFGGGRFIRWNILAQLPRLDADLDLTDLIPEFNLDLPSLPGLPNLSIALESLSSFGNPLDGLSFKLPSFGLRDMLDMLPNIELPKGGFNVGLSWSGDLLGVAIDLGNLFGTGDLAFGFRLPIQAMLDKLKQVGKWFGKIPDNVRSLANHLHLGSDGVLRIFDPSSQDPTARVGFDLKKLFDGVSPEDLVPVEAHGAIKSADGKKTLAEVSYGDAYVSAADERDAKLPDADGKGGGKHAGAVLVPRPSGTAIDHVTFTAPAWLREHLHAPENARIHASLYLPSDRNAGMVTLFAVVDGTDRGVQVRINIGELANLAKGLPKGNGDKGISIDRQASVGRGMLVLGVNTDAITARAGWKISGLLATPSLENLVPDELVLERKEGTLTAGGEIDVKGLEHRGDFDVGTWEIAKATLPKGVQKVAVYTNDFMGAAPRIALVDPAAEVVDGKRPGVELRLDHKFVKSLRKKLDELAAQARGKVSKVLKRAENESAPETSIHVSADASGVKLARGKEGDDWYMYGRWGWRDLGRLMEGDLAVDTMLPDAFRVATGPIAAEVKDLEDQADKPLPDGAKAVRDLHPLLREPLTKFGITEQQYIHLGLHDEKTKVVNEEKQLVRLHGAVYDVNESGKIADGKSLDIDVSLQALLAQVIPQNRRAWSKKKPRDPKKKFHVTGGVDIHETNGQADGIDMHAGVERTNAKGEQSEFEVRVGWTFDQILNMLMNLDQMITAEGNPNLDGAAGLMTPERLTGRFETDDFRVEFGNHGQASSMHTKAENIPGLEPLLGLVLDPATARAAELHLNLPDRDAFTKELDRATAELKKNRSLDIKVPLGGCALELPMKNADDPTAAPASKFYEVTLAISPLKFKSLLKLVPGIGQYLKIAELVVGVLEDPVGTLEGAMYAPEALYHVFSNAGETWDAIKKQGWQGIATSMFVNSDITNKQAVMAGRIHAKMKAKNWTKKGDKIPDIAGVDPEYLKWLAEQDGDQLVELAKLADTMDAMGLGQSFEKVTPTIPPGGKLPSVAAMREQIGNIEAGYREFAEVQQTAGDDQATVDAAADNLRKRIEKAIQAGAKPKGGVDMSGKAKSTDAPTHADDREYTDVSSLPPPTEADAKRAQDLFDDEQAKGDGKTDKDVVVVTMQDAQYLVNKYAGLTTEQLGEMLAGRSTKVTTNDGHIMMTMHPEEREFVRKLFLRRLAEEGIELKEGPGSGAADDANLVTAYQTAKARAERAAKAGGSGATDASNKDGKGNGDSDRISYEDDEGVGGGGSLDEVFGEGEEHGEGMEEREGGDQEGPEQQPEEGTEEGAAPAPGQGNSPGTQPSEEPASLRDVFKPSTREARSWMKFDAANGTARLDEEAVKSVIGLELPFQGEAHRLENISLVAYTSKGERENQVYQFTLELQVTSASTQRVPFQITHTYVYMPSQDRVQSYGGIQDIAGYQRKVNDAVDVISETAAVPSGSSRFTHEGWDMEVVEVTDVAPLRASTVSANVLFAFHKIPQDTVVVRTPDGPKVVRAGDQAVMNLPLDRDKK